MKEKTTLAVITLNRPKALNAINTGLLMELDSLLNSVAADKDVRAVIILLQR